MVSEGTDKGDVVALKLSSISVMVNHGDFYQNWVLDWQYYKKKCFYGIKNIYTFPRDVTHHSRCCVSTHYDWLMHPFKWVRDNRKWHNAHALLVTCGSRPQNQWRFSVGNQSNSANKESLQLLCDADCCRKRSWSRSMVNPCSAQPISFFCFPSSTWLQENWVEPSVEAGRKSNMPCSPFKICRKPPKPTSWDALLGNVVACASITDTSRLMKCHRLPVVIANNGRKTRLPTSYLSNSTHHIKQDEKETTKQRSVEVSGSHRSD